MPGEAINELSLSFSFIVLGPKPGDTGFLLWFCLKEGTGGRNGPITGPLGGFVPGESCTAFCLTEAVTASVLNASPTPLKPPIPAAFPSPAIPISPEPYTAS